MDRSFMGRWMRNGVEAGSLAAFHCNVMIVALPDLGLHGMALLAGFGLHEL